MRTCEAVGRPEGPDHPFPIRLSGPIIKGFGRGSKEVSEWVGQQISHTPEPMNACISPFPILSHFSPPPFDLDSLLFKKVSSQLH